MDEHENSRDDHHLLSERWYITQLRTDGLRCPAVVDHACYAFEPWVYFTYPPSSPNLRTGPILRDHGAGDWVAHCAEKKSNEREADRRHSGRETMKPGLLRGEVWPSA